MSTSKPISSLGFVGILVDVRLAALEVGAPRDLAALLDRRERAARRVGRSPHSAPAMAHRATSASHDRSHAPVSRRPPCCATIGAWTWRACSTNAFAISGRSTTSTGRCRRPQLPRDKEEAVVQASSTWPASSCSPARCSRSSATKTDDPTLKKIFSTFVADEKRHSAVARAPRASTTTSTTTATTSRARRSRGSARTSSRSSRNTSPEIANAYITSGELILDVALLRSLDDYVADEMSHAAMHLINRDESRHIAIDFHMTEHYCSDEYLAAIRARPRPTVARDRRMARALATMMWHAKPFLQQVFLAPMDRTDPTRPPRPGGVQAHPARAAQADRRAHAVLAVHDRAAGRSTTTRSSASCSARSCCARSAPRIAPRGSCSRSEELARTQRMSFDELAEEALAVKYS